MVRPVDSSAQDLAVLADLMKEIRVTMLTTVAGDGSLTARPMVTQELQHVPFDGTLWFITARSSAKAEEIEQDQHVNLAYANPDEQVFISLSGRARMMNNREKIREIWTPYHEAFFPNGPEDPELTLICVAAESAEVWKGPPGEVLRLSRLAQAMGGREGESPSRRRTGETNQRTLDELLESP